MKVVWTTSGKDDLLEIVSHIWKDDPAAAQRMGRRIESLAAQLEHHPYMGRPGAVSGTREAIPHPSYRLVYQMAGDEVMILAVVHTARQWPPGKGKAD